MKEKTEAVVSCHERNRKKLERTQRVIMFARKQAGMTQMRLAKRIYVSYGTMACYESGKLKAPWDRLEEALPGLKNMREKGCEAYCEFAEECKNGLCVYRKKGMTQRKEGKREYQDSV